jgi:serine/threonine protein phosphatase PrpC
MRLALRYAARTDVGLGPKTRNEDSGYAGPHLLAVADGMGGTVGGDVASATTIMTVRALDTPSHPEPLRALGQAAIEANARIAERIETDPHLEGMGTTLTAALFDGYRASVAHIGDSRAYLLRDGRLRMLTHDHTFVQSLVDEGRITPEEAEVHPHRSLIIRALEGRQDARPDLFAIELEVGDRLLLCSDGLDNAGIKDPVIEAILLRNATPDEAAAALVEAALRQGSPDNVTCVVADLVDANEVDASMSEPVLVGAVSEADPRLFGDLGGGDFPSGRGPSAPSDPVPPPSPTETTAPLEATPPIDEEPPPDDEEPDPEELRYAPRPPSRFRWLTRLCVTVVALGLIGVGLRMAYDWTQRQYYVGPYPAGSTDLNSRVAIFRGISQQIPGVKLSEVFELQNLQLSQLPPYERERVVCTIAADDLRHARSIVAELTAKAAGYTTPPPNRRLTPSPTLTTDAPRSRSSSRHTEEPTAGAVRSWAADRQADDLSDVPVECDPDDSISQPTGQK